MNNVAYVIIFLKNLIPLQMNVNNVQYFVVNAIVDKVDIVKVVNLMKL